MTRGAGDSTGAAWPAPARSKSRGGVRIALAAALIGATWGCAATRDRFEASSRRWFIPAHQPESVLIRFAFAPPNESYGGEVRAAEGFIFVECATESAAGRFIARAADVDMGEADLTRNVRFAAEMLDGEAHPTASFVFHQADPLNPGSLRRLMCEGQADGTVISVTLRGVFQLKDVSEPLDVPAELAGESPGVRVLTAHFEIDELQRRFGIAAPGSPDTLLFEVRFRLIGGGAGSD